MKKRIICFVLMVIMAVLLVVPVCAASDAWILMGDAEYIIHGEDKYYPVEFPYYCFVDYNLTFATVDLEIKDQRFAETYASSFANIPQGYSDMVIEVVLFEDNMIGKTVHYVEDDYLDNFFELRDGKAGSYVIENNNMDYVPITEADIDRWSMGESRTIVGDDVDYYRWYGIYACDESGIFMHQIGLIFQDILEEDELYLLKYDECDPMCFEDNIFTGHALATYKIYEIDDDLEDVVAPEVFDSMDYKYPLYNSDSDVSGFAIAFLSLIFGIIPLGLVSFGVVKAITCKDKKYRTAFIVLAASAALTLAAFLAILAIALI